MDVGNAGGIQRDLIYDLGLHCGEDAEFYLKKGFRVVAVDANADICEKAHAKLAKFIEGGALTIINRAIASEPGQIIFYHNDCSVWGTVDPDWAAHNMRLGSNIRERTVDATTMEAILAEHGTPYFVKIDIEGMDMVALRGLRAVAERPRYVSIESNKDSFRELRREFETFLELGYDRFKLVPQRWVSKQRLPNPPKEGQYVQHSFALGSSGAFGDEAPGDWMTAEEAIEAYRPVFLNYALTGDDPFVRSKFFRNGLKALGFRPNWYDTHAKRSAA